MLRMTGYLLRVTELACPLPQKGRRKGEDQTDREHLDA